MSLDIKDEAILLREWTLGKHKEDMDLFEPKVFGHSKLFGALRSGATLGQLGANIKEYHWR